MHSIPPRITEKSYRLRVSNRTMVGVLEPPRFACVASGPKASNHRVMKPSSRLRRLPWSVRGTSRTQSLSRSQIGLDANRHIHLLSERTEGIFFLDMSSHRAHRTHADGFTSPVRGRITGSGRVIAATLTRYGFSQRVVNRQPLSERSSCSGGTPTLRGRSAFSVVCHLTEF